ncbi:hypothetical protein [Janthinobacterium sp. NKUCC06_STL]|uniref:hypothetical protein n=1 Tax=Janthinobacterium sp. NKUCC06_STL TaxID=2842127 RepID=UPI00214AED75|nr:hypothetical protein [Janthinobacterium sp. NKUCC06_STL]
MPPWAWHWRSCSCAVSNAARCSSRASSIWCCASGLHARVDALDGLQQIHRQAGPSGGQDRTVLAAATADNTRRAYRFAVNHYLACGGVLSADEAEIIRYQLAYAATLNPRTLALRLTGFSQWDAHQAFPDPASTPTVHKTLTGIARTHGSPKKKAKALLQIGIFGGLRRNELVVIVVEHLSWTPEGIEIMLPRSRTDQLGEGIVNASRTATALAARRRRCGPGSTPPGLCYGRSASGAWWRTLSWAWAA